MKTFVDNPQNVRCAEVVVGIPSLNEADGIAMPTAMADRGLTEFFPDRTAVIVNVDNHSPDGTREAFLGTETAVPKIYVSTPEGVRGKGNNLRNLFRAAVELQARAVVVVDADLNTITPNWIRYLAEPVLDGFDHVTPLYVRHKYDGTITNHIAYPLTRALFGLRVRQPIGGDFGFSGRFASALLGERLWTDDVGRFGIDIWMTVLAIARHFNVCQAFLGTAKGHRPKDPAGDLTPMFTQVVGTLFELMAELPYRWREVTASRPSSVFGFGLGIGDTVEPIEIDGDALLASFRAGAEEHAERWEEVLSPSVMRQAAELGKVGSAGELSFPTDLWAKVLYDYAIAHRDAGDGGHDLLLSMAPFYHARVLSFVNRTLEMGTREAEEYLENITRTFQREKPYLIERWDATANDAGQRLFG